VIERKEGRKTEGREVGRKWVRKEGGKEGREGVRKEGAWRER
jgi:hypothetical protein